MIRFLIDECASPRILQAIEGWNRTRPHEWIEAVVVEMPDDLPRSTLDFEILEWAERNHHLVLTTDFSTMPTHLKDHLAAGKHCPGILCIRPGIRTEVLLNDLAMITHASDPAEFVDCIHYIPM